MSEDGDSEKPKGTPSKEAASLKIEVGKRYGYRKQRYAIGQSLRPVLVTKLGPPKSNKYRVRWLDGEYEGLEEWVRRETLLCPWEEAVPFVEDEVRLARAVDASLRAYETEEWQTVREVFWAVDAPFELAMWARYRGVVIVEDFRAMLAIVGAWCGQEYVQRFDLLAELREEVTRLRTLFIETLNWMREMAEENKLKWLMSKYVSLYEELNGEPPPNVPKRKRARRV